MDASSPLDFPQSMEHSWKPLDLHGLQTYDLKSRPSKVFHEDLGKPVNAGASIGEWIESLPRQLAGKDIRRIRDCLWKAHEDRRVRVAAVGGHVIKTGCGPYLIDWIQRGMLSAIAMNGAAAIHDFELAVGGKTSEDVAAQLPRGQFGMVRETADAFAIAARAGAEHDLGLGWALGKYMEGLDCAYADSSVVLAAYRAGIPCTVHVAFGTDIVHMHPACDPAALGRGTHLDFRIFAVLVDIGTSDTSTLAQFADRVTELTAMIGYRILGGPGRVVIE